MTLEGHTDIAEEYRISTIKKRSMSENDQAAESENTGIFRGKVLEVNHTRHGCVIHTSLLLSEEHINTIVLGTHEILYDTGTLVRVP